MPELTIREKIESLLTDQAAAYRGTPSELASYLVGFLDGADKVLFTPLSLDDYCTLLNVIQELVQQRNED